MNSSMLAPGMPTSVLVVRPFPCVVADVVVVVHAAAHVQTVFALKTRVQLPPC